MSEDRSSSLWCANARQTAALTLESCMFLSDLQDVLQSGSYSIKQQIELHTWASKPLDTRQLFSSKHFMEIRTLILEVVVSGAEETNPAPN